MWVHSCSPLRAVGQRVRGGPAHSRCSGNVRFHLPHRDKLDMGRNYSCFTAPFSLVICLRVPSGVPSCWYRLAEGRGSHVLWTDWASLGRSGVRGPAPGVPLKTSKGTLPLEGSPNLSDEHRTRGEWVPHSHPHPPSGHCLLQNLLWLPSAHNILTDL